MTLKNLSFTRQAPLGANREEIAAAEAKLNVHFPPGFVEFCSRWNGGFPNADNEFYPVRASFEDFHNEYGEGEGVLISVLYGISESLLQTSLVKKSDLLEIRSGFGIIPIGGDMFGSQVVFGADSPPGQIYWRDKDLWEIPENPAPGPQFAEKPRLIQIANDLESFYNSLTRSPGQ
ncbi:MAG TPA: SMI1/KNR4 family protein [Verrucomicrobiae bacterium]|jgi:hypothetical protein|nr:SMI1/KNR4 family protein [Verrucomicrobiae bacterium]